uniref:Uncharacterized protein n=1 Tax=viral metagenome TaxID=1070528 RepID=A0A6C0LRJ6_9ZZZZ
MSDKNVYRLINPYIDGKMDTIIRSKNSFNAGKHLYNSLSKYFTNHVENFFMTIQNVETKELTHFKINETKRNSNNIDFHMNRIDENLPNSIEKSLIENVDKLSSQTGGKKKYKYNKYDDSSDSDSDSSTSSNSSSSENRLISPINKFIYFSLPYYKLNLVGLNNSDLNSIFMPVFSWPINPTVEIRLDLYKI